MDQELTSFVDLLKKNRAPGPVPEGLSHLPNWAQHALSKISEPVVPRRAAPPNGAAAATTVKSNIAIKPLPPAIRSTGTQPPLSNAIAEIMREPDGSPFELPDEIIPFAPPLAPMPVMPIAVAETSAMTMEPDADAAALEIFELTPVSITLPPAVTPPPSPTTATVELARATLKKIEAATALAEMPYTSKAIPAVIPPAIPVAEALTVSIAPPVAPAPDLINPLRAVFQNARKPAPVSESEAIVAAKQPIRRPVSFVVVGTAAIAFVALVAASYWYANQPGQSLARNIMTMSPWLPDAPKTVAKAAPRKGSNNRSPSNGISKSPGAVMMAALKPTTTPVSAPAAPSEAKPRLVAATPSAPAAAQPAATDRPGKTVVAAAVLPVAMTPTPLAMAQSPAKDPQFQQVAMLTPMPAPRPPERIQNTGKEPTWLRNASPTPPYTGQPQIAIVIDDLGIDPDRTQRAIALDGPVTLSFLAYASDLPQQTEAAHRAGHELIVHVPMEPIIRPKLVSAGTNGDHVAHDEMLRRLHWDLSRFTGYVGVNNHTGNRLGTDPESTKTVVAELKARGLLFLDSRGANGGVVAVAERLGVPTVSRDVFLDDDVGASSIDERLAALEKIARAHGTAVAIGHPHDRTLEALKAWLAGLPSKGLQLVPLTTIVKDREQHVAGAN